MYVVKDDGDGPPERERGDALADRQVRQTDHEPPRTNTLQLLALVVSTTGLVLGPCFGAGVAVIGTYVSIQSKSAVSDQKVDALAGKVDALGVALHEVSQKVDAGTNGGVELKTKIEAQDKRLDEAFTKIGMLEAHDSKQETQNAELLGILRKK